MLWKDLVQTAFARGFRVPALTGYLGLTVGGTLSVGGISPSYREGGQVDRVQELEVVTGAGQIVRCSEGERPTLFEAALAGLGQCGIITRMKMDLVPALPMVRVCWRSGRISTRPGRKGAEPMVEQPREANGLTNS